MSATCSIGSGARAVVQQRRQVGAAQILHHQIRRSVLGDAEVDHLHDVAVIDLRGGQRLPHEPGAQLLIERLRSARGQDRLQRHGSTEPAVQRAIHRPHAALADQLEQLITINAASLGPRSHPRSCPRRAYNPVFRARRQLPAELRRPRGQNRASRRIDRGPAAIPIDAPGREASTSTTPPAAISPPPCPWPASPTPLVRKPAGRSAEVPFCVSHRPSTFSQAMPQGQHAGAGHRQTTPQPLAPVQVPAVRRCGGRRW